MLEAGQIVDRLTLSSIQRAGRNKSAPPALLFAVTRCSPLVRPCFGIELRQPASSGYFAPNPPQNPDLAWNGDRATTNNPITHTMTKLSFGTLLATLAVFAWGAIFWMNPLPYSFFAKTTDDAATGKVLLERFPASGTYLILGLQDDQRKFTELYKAGPIGMVHLQRQGDEAMSVKTLAQGFLQELVVVMLIGALLTMAGASLQTYVARVRFVTITGVAAVVFGSLECRSGGICPGRFISFPPSMT